MRVTARDGLPDGNRDAPTEFEGPVDPIRLGRASRPIAVAELPPDPFTDPTPQPQARVRVLRIEELGKLDAERLGVAVGAREQLHFLEGPKRR